MGEMEWRWMKKALALAERGRGHVEPNPLVGAVVMKADAIIGQGWHQRFGGPHAEIHALKEAGAAARGATLFVTLEPCCHWGKTPPCTDAIVRAGISRVVAAMPDPFSRVGGKGFLALRSQGVLVEHGLGEAMAKRLNLPYLKLTVAGRPYVHAKWAMTLDGKICTRTGASKWISNEAALQRTHQLRGRMDAIIAGIGTVLADDPLLTVRPRGPRIPARIILDSRGRLPNESRLVKSTVDAPVLVATAGELSPERTADLRREGVEVLPLLAEQGRPAVTALLDELGKRRMTNVLVEGGSEVLGSFFDAQEIDAVHVCIAPRLLGGSAAKGPVGGFGVEGLADALKLAEWWSEVVQGNILVDGRR